jgi:hypothetical protein
MSTMDFLAELSGISCKKLTRDWCEESETSGLADWAFARTGQMLFSVREGSRRRKEMQL